jgi:UDP-GlcNAc3NAcA epimerase
MKIVTIVGARPQFVKAGSVSEVLRNNGHTEILVHTGQHYDANMSDIFFEELNIPKPDINLGIGSGSHGAQTGTMLQGIENVLVAENPDWLLVYGDTNSTLAGALAAAKLHVRIAHVEAGLRSFNRRMPEEINRVVTDHVSSLLFCPSQTAVNHLAAEGIVNGVYNVGDVMYDAVLKFSKRAQSQSKILSTLDLSSQKYLLATVHRAENTDDPIRLQNILSAFAEIQETIVWPVHPRTRKVLERLELNVSFRNLRLVDPVGYLDMLQLQQNARIILTDSGGIQKEAYWLGVPCVTLRDETEWVETVEAGWNKVTGADVKLIIKASNEFLSPPPLPLPPFYGDGHASQLINTIMTES